MRLDNGKYQLENTIHPEIPQEEVVALLSSEMAKHPKAEGFLLDGFPANLEQAEICKETFGEPT